ncbi:hypothetical protein OIU77_018153 [Salix suchowensis]|uniref:Uncharacterized protein n=1 Tax=Salix suchowensis TaxID=1278906 RepID=A0ABQ8ZRV2_9ROSI|nr:hypothetical protein OIU77_018153 [Salix suchowensis]
MSRSKTLNPKQKPQKPTPFCILQNLNLVKNQRFFPVLNRSSNFAFVSLQAVIFLSLVAKLSVATTSFQIHVQGIPCRHQMLVVNKLDKTLDPGFLSCFLG